MLLAIGLHPSLEMEMELCFAYNRWLPRRRCRKERTPSISLLCLPFSIRRVLTLWRCSATAASQTPGFPPDHLTSVPTPVYHNAYMKLSRGHGGAASWRSASIRRHIVEPLFKSSPKTQPPVLLGACAGISILQNNLISPIFVNQRGLMSRFPTAGDLDERAQPGSRS